MGSPSTIKLIKRLGIWTSVFIVLLVVFFGVVRLGVFYSSDILYQLVKRETNGYYQLSFEEINIHPWNKTIKLKKVLLKPDPNRDYQAKGLNNLYEMEMSGLNIDLKSIISIYTDRQLLIRNIRIIDPRIHVSRKMNAPDESFSLQTGNLYKEISDYLRVLQIDIFAIENAVLKHSPSELSINNIDFLISNLLIDSASRPDQRFYSENIELEIHNQSFRLNDSIHQLSFDRLLLSTADSILTFENLVLKPTSDAQGLLDKLEDKTIYDIAIPTLRLKGVDYFSAYRYNHLEMEELSITDSQIFLEEQTSEQIIQPGERGNSILEQLISVFDEVSIGKMRFINANLNLKTNSDYNNNYQHVQSERADIVLYNFLLDSSNYQFNIRNKYFDDVDINIKDYRSYLPDSIHTIHFDLLKLSSIDSSLIFKNFNISNNGKGSSKDMFLSIDLPLIHLKGLNYMDILLHKQLLIREMLLQHPNIVFEMKHDKVGNLEFTPDSLYTMIMGQFELVGIKKLQIDQGIFSINKLLNFEQTDLLVTNINIPNDSNSWYDVLNEFELELHHMVLNDEALKLQANHIKLDRLASRLILDDLHLDYLDPYASASGDLSSLTISGIDLNRIFMGDPFAFDSLTIIDPRINMVIFKPMEGEFMSDISPDKFVEIVNGKIHVKTYDSTSIKLDKIYTELNLGTRTNIQFADVEQLTITLPKTSNRLNISNLNISDSQNLLLKDVRIEQVKDTLLHQVELAGHIPTLSFYGMNQNRFWQDNTIEGDSLIIKTPDLDLTLNKIGTSLISADSFEVQIQKIILDKGQLNYADASQPEIKMIKAPQLSVTLEGFHYPLHPMVSADHLFYSDDITLDIKHLRPVMTNGDSLSIEQLSFSKNDALINLNTLRFAQANGATSALFPNIRIMGFDPHAYLNDRRLKLDSLKLIAPEIIHDQSVSENNQRLSQNALPETIDIDYISSVSTEIEFRNHLKSTSYAMHKGQFEVRKFFIEGTFTWKRFFEYAQYAAISGHDLIVPLDDGYQLSVAHYDLHHPTKTLRLDNINLTSEYTPSEYTKTLTYQKDWFDVDADNITLSGLDFQRSLGKREFYTGKLAIGGLKALIYRDKSVPLNTSVVKELPQGMLRNIEQWIHIDTLQVKGDITHQIKPENREEIAEITFNALNASLFQVTTADHMVNGPMRLVSNGKLADTAPFKAIAVFDMNDPKNPFSFSGQIDQMPLDALNKLLRPLANINIKDGYAERIGFSMKGNNDIATGEMNFHYEDLKIQILNPETYDMQGLNQEIKTFFANTFVIKQNNPTFLVLRPGTIFQRRDPSRVIFHYWGEALLSGAVSSIGINKSRKDEKKYDKEVEANSH